LRKIANRQTNKQTNRQTNDDDYISSLAEVMKRLGISRRLHERNERTVKLVDLTDYLKVFAE